MSIHRLVTQLLNDTVLPYVIHVHGLEIPYRAELWIGDVRKHKHGVVSFHISENGYLTAEYVAYDASILTDHLGLSVLDEDDYKVLILETQVDIPVFPISTSRTKARTLYGMTNVPQVVVYEGRISGWLGHTEEAMDSVTMLLTGFPNINLPSLTKLVPDRPIGGNLELRGKEVSNSVLSLEVDEWIVRFFQPTTNGDDELIPISRNRTINHSM